MTACRSSSIQRLANPQPGDQGVLNQAVLLHEALHGYTGKFDLNFAIFVPFHQQLIFGSHRL